MKLSLSGFMGAGKSTVAASLASRLGMPLLETDQMVLALSGEAAIAGIFARYGEAHFRALEKQVARELSTLDYCLISTGGGFVIDSGNVRCLRSSGGKIIYLACSFETVQKRVSHLADRPLFKDLNSARKLFAQRQPIYEACCDYTVSVDDKSVSDISEEIEKMLLGERCLK